MITFFQIQLNASFKSDRQLETINLMRVHETIYQKSESNEHGIYLIHDNSAGQILSHGRCSSKTAWNSDKTFSVILRARTKKKGKTIVKIAGR